MIGRQDSFLLLKLIFVFKILRGENLQEAILFSFSIKLPTGAGKIVQWFGALATLPEALGSVPSIHIVAHSPLLLLQPQEV